MSLIIRQALAKNAQEKRAMQAQWNHVQELRSAGDPAMKAFLQMTNAGIMELEDAKKLSVKSLNGLLAKSGVVVANGAGGFVANSSYEPLPE